MVVEELEYEDLFVFQLDYLTVDHFMVILESFSKRSDWNAGLVFADDEHLDRLLRIAFTND